MCGLDVRGLPSRLYQMRESLRVSPLTETRLGRLQLTDVQKRRSCKEQDEGKDSPFGEGRNYLHLH